MTRSATHSFVFALLLSATSVISAQDSELKYKVQPSPLYYTWKAEAEFETGRPQKFEASLIYKVEAGNGGSLRIFDTLRLKTTRSSYYSSSSSSFYRLSRYPYSGGSSDPTTIEPSGKLIDVSAPNWMLGLPVDLSRIAFPQLSDEDTWTLETPVSLVNGRRGGLQLASVAPQIRNDRRSYNPRDKATKSVVAIAQTTCKVTARDGDTVTISEAFELDGSRFGPQVSVSGTGTIVFSTKLGSVNSIQRSYKVNWKEPNRQMVVPIKVSLTRFTDEELAAYEAEVKKQAERTEKIRAEQAAMREKVPDLKDRDAVMAVVQEGSKELFDLLISKMESEKLSDDEELANALYDQLFARERAPYHTKAVIVRLAPKLEKTTALADKYANTYASFDAAMTGNEITPETKLMKDQIICYRKSSGSSFRSGHLYGAVEDVLVIRTRSTRPELLAIKCEDCRLPVRDFVDPALKPSE